MVIPIFGNIRQMLGETLGEGKEIDEDFSNGIHIFQGKL